MQLSCYFHKRKLLVLISSFIPFHWLWAWDSYNCYIRPRVGNHFLWTVEVPTNLSPWKKIWSRAALDNLPTWKIVWKRNNLPYYLNCIHCKLSITNEYDYIVKYKVKHYNILCLSNNSTIPVHSTSKKQWATNLKCQTFIYPSLSRKE